MPGYRKKQPVRNLTRLFRMLGIQFPEDMPKVDNHNNIEINSHTQSELRYMPGMSILEQNADKNIDSAGLSSYLNKVAQTNCEWIEQADAIRILTPEIERSAEIMVSSIMSPTDMQTDSINIICEGSDLGDDIEAKVGEKLSNFFNDTLDIGDKTYNYTKNALYGEGSSAILILPPKNIDNLNNAIDADLMKAGVIKRSGKKIKITADNTVLVDGKGMSSGEVFSSVEYLLPDDKEQIASLETLIEADLYSSIEARNPFVGLNLNSDEVITRSKDARDAILKLFRNSNKHIIMSSDIQSIRRGADRMSSMADKLARDAEKNFLFSGGTNPTYMVDSTLDDSDRNPAVVEIPTRAVVPVIIPGTPEKHIGYFILVDQWGSPVYDTASDRQTMFGPKKLSKAATQAAFGAPNLYRFNSSQMSDEQRYDLTSTIFGITLKRLMEAKLEDIGLAGTTIAEYDAISACLFRNLIMHKKCAMVFVPEPLMVYFRFDHRPDGTGKSIPESMNTMLALRTVLLMSYIMAATENSVNNKTITVNVDEKQTNIQQYLDMVRNAYVQKKMMRFDVNPLTVQQDLIQKSLTILPKGIKGLSDSLDVQTEHRSTGAISPDNDLMDKLSNWIITWLQVPHSALNHLSENEYSRSVATTNLFFSNNVKSKQKVVERHMTKFIKLYTRYSYPLRKQLEEVLRNTSITKRDNESSEATVIKGDIEVNTNDAGIKKNIEKIISCIKVSLPSPKIVVDKAQYEEIEKYLDTIDKICEAVYPDNSLEVEELSELKGTLTIMRAAIKSNMVRDYIDNIGFQSSYDMPYPENIDMKNIRDTIQFLANQRKGIKDWMLHIVNKAKSENPDEPNPDGDGTNDFGGGSGDDDLGGGNDLGGDLDTGGGDQGSGPAEDLNVDQEPPSLDTEEGKTPEEGQTPTEGTEPTTEANPGENKEPESEFDNFKEPPSF